ncbi:MAG TPA: twin-arginine translocase TatA/TatE family subunit [Edaphobacter sp.]|nr:twin-arginine translocase TatA/TatE family subunit [Edaphobacter sp.]
MPSFQDSAVIFFIALLLFGPKKLPELARQLGKLMGEFRRASNEFRMQMEDELRVAEQAEQQKKIAAMEAAAPVTPAITDGTENTIAQPADSTVTDSVTDSFVADQNHDFTAESTPATTPLPIATSGDLNLMPPSTGLPVANSSPYSSPSDSSANSMSHAFDSIPHVPDPEVTRSTQEYALQQTPDHTQGHTADDTVDQTNEAPLHHG